MDDFKVSLSRQTITQRIADLSVNIKDQVFKQSKSFDLYLIACDESTDASDKKVKEIPTQKIMNQSNKTQKLNQNT